MRAIDINAEVKHRKKASYIPQIVGCSLGPHINYVAPIVPDTRYHVNVMEGEIHRVCCEKKPFNAVMMHRFKGFVHYMVRLLFRAITTAPSFDEWLDGRPYTMERKKVLREIWSKSGKSWRNILSKRNWSGIKAHGKRECMEDFKYLRMIHSREDDVKVMTGPFVHACEQEVFKSGYFAKGISIDKWPDHIKTLMDKYELYCTNDFTSFESLIYGKLQDAVEGQFIRYMGSYDNDFAKCVDTMIRGKQRIRTRSGLRASCFARMSGDMQTSLGNGLTNFMILCFLHNEANHTRYEICPCFVEGDDSIFGFHKNQLDRVSQVMDGLGMRAKIAHTNDIGSSGFCSMFWNVQGKYPDLVSDYREPLVKLFWTLTGRETRLPRRMGLLRAKCLSLICQFPACPILTEAALYGIRITSKYKVIYNRYDQWWDHYVLGKDYGRNDIPDRAIEPLGRGIQPATRLFYDSKFNVPVATQLRIEEYFRLKTDLEPINDSDIINGVSKPSLHKMFFSWTATPAALRIPPF